MTKRERVEKGKEKEAFMAAKNRTTACLAPVEPFSNGLFYGDNPFDHGMPLIMLQIVITVFMSHLLCFLLRPLKQPRVVCDIIVSICLGPAAAQLLYQLLLFSHHYLGRPAAEPELMLIMYKYISFVFRPEGMSILRVVANYGAMLHFYLIATRVNASGIWAFGKKTFVISGCALGLSYLVLSRLLPLFKDPASSTPDFTVLRGIGSDEVGYYLIMSVATFSFPVIGDILAELRLLNTELGRLTMSAAMIGDLSVSSYVLVTSIINKAKSSNLNALGTFNVALGGILFIAFLLGVFLPWTRWIVRRTPKGGRVWEGHVLMVIMVVHVGGIYSDWYLTSLFDAPILLGLLMPDGPPLGTAVVEWLHLITAEVLVPVTFLVGGRLFHFAKVDTSVVFFIILYMFAGYAAKIVGAMIPALYWNIPPQNAAFIGLLLNCNGLAQFMTYTSLVDTPSGGLMETTAFVAAVSAGTVMTAAASFLVSTLYNPLNTTHMVGRRTVQHLGPHIELRLVVGVLNEEPTPLVLNLLEAACGNDHTPMCVYVLHLVELLGKVSSTLVAHKNKNGYINHHQMHHLHNIFLNYEQAKRGVFVVQPFTATSPYKTMHHDVCSLAMEKNVHLVLVTFPRKGLATNADATNQVARSIVRNVLAQAPCSVGILVYHPLAGGVGLPDPRQFLYHVRVFFWSGKDDREALACAARMAHHPGVHIRVTRFITTLGRRDDVQLSMDEDAIKEFKMYNSANAHVMFEEMTVSDFEQTIPLIRSIDNEYDLVVVGKQQDASLLHCKGLDEWSDTPELGVVGDIFASSDFNDFSFSTLVVQQQG